MGDGTSNKLEGVGSCSVRKTISLSQWIITGQVPGTLAVNLHPGPSYKCIQPSWGPLSQQVFLPVLQNLASLQPADSSPSTVDPAGNLGLEQDRKEQKLLCCVSSLDATLRSEAEQHLKSVSCPSPPNPAWASSRQKSPLPIASHSPSLKRDRESE